MTITETLRDAAPAFLRRPLDPKPAAPPATRPHAMLDQIAADLANAHPEPLQPATFTDQLREFGTGADALMTAHRATTDRLRLALAENALLRARNTDLEAHTAEITAYWERQYEAVNTRMQRISRLYDRLTGRFDMAIESLIETRAAAKWEAFAADDAEPPRPAGVEVTERNAEPEPDDPVVTRLRAPQDRLPPVKF